GSAPSTPRPVRRPSACVAPSPPPSHPRSARSTTSPTSIRRVWTSRPCATIPTPWSSTTPERCCSASPRRETPSDHEHRRPPDLDVPSRPTSLFHPDHSGFDVDAMTPEALAGEALELADAVAEQLRGHGRVGVAYSGGVDSATLLALAVRALGSENVVALLGVSPSLARRERRLAHRVAAVIGAEVIEVPTSEGENPDYQKNDASRCFHCKNELFTRIDDEIVEAQQL